jgi:DNA-binding Lrp family transcriptional regulator
MNEQTDAAFDRALISATQAGLPLTATPYLDVARALGVSELRVMERMQAMQADGRIRRIGAIPNHYALGLTANGMSVWDVDDAALLELGTKIGALPFVTHCYERPRALPAWPYNLFAMVHGAARSEVEDKVGQIKALLGSRCRQHDILYSTRILKKTGLRIKP